MFAIHTFLAIFPNALQVEFFLLRLGEVGGVFVFFSFSGGGAAAADYVYAIISK